MRSVRLCKVGEFGKVRLGKAQQGGLLSLLTCYSQRAIGLSPSYEMMEGLLYLNSKK